MYRTDAHTSPDAMLRNIHDCCVHGGACAMTDAETTGNMAFYGLESMISPMIPSCPNNISNNNSTPHTCSNSIPWSLTCEPSIFSSPFQRHHHAHHGHHGQDLSMPQATIWNMSEATSWDEAELKLEVGEIGTGTNGDKGLDECLSYFGEKASRSTEDKGEALWVPEDLHQIGYQDADGTWRCRHPTCTSERAFVRMCDLRKHYKMHEKRLYCEEEQCRMAQIGFSTNKDLLRHRASHDPQLRCPLSSCDRKFSRLDNAINHYRKVHQQTRNTIFPKPCRRRKTDS